MADRLNQQRPKSRWPKVLAWFSVLALVAAALLMAGAGPAYRWEWVGLRGGTAFVAIAVLIATAALLYMPWQQWQRAQQAPVIHDITTDTQNPPAFIALREEREAAPNGLDYPGDATAEQQREATAVTRWFGFEDDVAIRLTEQGQSTQVDVRSASRLGASDVGTNALRIETFLNALRERLE